MKLLYLLSFWLIVSRKVDESKLITRLAFGSCTNSFSGNNPQIYSSITSFTPDLFIWLGDVIYADKFRFFSRVPEPNLSLWLSKYNTLKSSPEYLLLSNSSMITGIWDDHDYGTNNGGKSFPNKIASKSMYLNFLEDGSVRDHEGIYHSFVFGELRLILIDIRWFRDDKDPDGDSLGEEQWKWLEEQMQGKEKLKIIANGLQVNTFDRIGPAEKWHEKSRLRLWELVKVYGGVVLLSGDVHYAEIMKVDCAGRVIVEVTASGMGHSVSSTFSAMGWFLVNVFHSFNFNVGPKVLVRNFGTMEIDWERGEIEVGIRDTYGNVRNSYRFLIEDLQKNTKKSEICSAGLFRLKFFHFVAALGVLCLPVSIWLLSLLIYLRKYSNSY